MEATYLFVYGTLLANVTNAWSADVRNNSTRLGKGSFTGRLFDLGAYPGAVLSDLPEERVFGEILQVTDDAEFWHRLDQYEGAIQRKEIAKLFTRETVSVWTESGQIIQAWVYLYHRDITGHPRIWTGDYLHRLRTEQFGGDTGNSMTI